MQLLPCSSKEPISFAQIAEMSFWEELATKSKSGENEENSELPPLVDPETNIYSFGLVLLETVTAKLPYSEEQGPLLNWVSLCICILLG